MSELPYPYCYIGRLPCGCTVAVCVDMSADGLRGRKSLARALSEMALHGLTMERVKTADVKLVAAWDCPHEKTSQERQQPLI